MTLQGKGGVGKSFICTLLAQYKMAKGPAPLCVDTDAVNGTFHGFGALNVVKLDVLEGKEINRGKFDKLVELIVENDGRRYNCRQRGQYLRAVVALHDRQQSA